ncbi:MAG: ATP-binding protein [Bellilinea sp.]|jgi:signal transduction histidine kinase
MMENPAEDRKIALTPEILVPRLGDYLVERGLITNQQLQNALQHQAVLRKTQHEAARLGELLVQLGIITRANLDEAITEHVLQLRNALQETNRQLEQRVKERTAELEKALQKLSELSQLKANFIANISHELRTPLTHIRGYQDLLTSGDLGGINEQQLLAVRTMQKSTDRLERLIEDLILFATAERAHLPVQWLPVNLRLLSEEIIQQIQPKALDHQHKLILRAPAEVPDVYGDFEKIGWVLHQLIDNAIKFTPPGGTISVELIADDLHITVRVSDSGIGIPPSRLNEIFEPFHQLDNSSTRKYGGTGLGLSLAKKIVEAHDSSIQVISELGRGSRFSFALKKKLGPFREK